MDELLKNFSKAWEIVKEHLIAYSKWLCCVLPDSKFLFLYLLKGTFVYLTKGTFVYLPKGTFVYLTKGIPTSVGEMKGWFCAH